MIKEISQHLQWQKAAHPTLFHPDLNKRNIFVSEQDPTMITAIIDWQSAAVEPAFWYADEIPDFVKPDINPTIEDQAKLLDELRVQAFDKCTQFLTPTLAGPRLMDEGLFRPFRYCYRTWKDGAVAFQHELIETARDWRKLGLPGISPLPVPSAEQLQAHQKDYQRFLAAQELRINLSKLLNTASDGWVPTQDWETAQQGQGVMFNGMRQAVIENDQADDDEPIRTEEDLREIWPFDL